MIDEFQTPSVAQWKLGRLASRALRVLAQHRGVGQVIAGYETSLPAAVEAFEQKHSVLAKHLAARRRLTAGRYKEAERLLRAMRGWLGLLSRDVPGFDAAEYVSGTGVADDIIRQATRLIDVVTSMHAQTPLACGDAVLAELAPLVASAREEWEQVQGGLARTQELQAECRGAANALQAQLVAFRRSLRAVLGASHRDYQSLRESRVESEADKQEADATLVVTAPVVAAPVARSSVVPNGHA